MKILLGFACLIVAFLLWGLLDLVYSWIKRNRKRIGLPVPECRFLDKGDSVCFGRRVYEFMHLGSRHDALNSEDFAAESLKPGDRILTFRQVDNKEYLYLPESSLEECTFICNKHGVKWALNEDWEASANERIKYFYD